MVMGAAHRPSWVGARGRAAPAARRWGEGTALCLLALLCLLVPATARADGDPASDVLLTQKAFYPYQPQPSPKLEAALNALLAQASGAGMPLKVAIVGSREDLGAVPSYFGHPQQYATFLDREISNNKLQPLLVVMPAGFGLADADPVSALAHVSTDTSAYPRTDGLVRAAILAVTALARANGHSIALPPIVLSSTTRRGGSPSAILFGIPVLLLVLAGVPVLARHRHKTRR